MKHLFLLLIFSTIHFSGISQINENTKKVNYEWDLMTDSIRRKDLQENNDYLLSDTILRFFDTIRNPNFYFQKNLRNSEIENLIKTFFSERKSIMKGVSETQTLLLYSIGTNNTQVLDIHHLQKINEKIHTEIKLNKNKSDGFYLNQKMKTDFIEGNFQVKNKKSNYFVIPYYIFRGKEISENGGIKSDSIFKSGDFTNSMTLETRLTGASNKWEIHHGGIDQIHRSENTKFNFILKDNLSYRYQRRTYRDDPNQFFYDTIYLDTLQTKDIYEYSAFHHSVSLSASQKKWKANLQFVTESANYKNGRTDTTSLLNKINFNSDYINNKNIFNIHAYYTFTGFNKNNHAVNFKYKRTLGNFINDLTFKLNYLNFYSDFSNYSIDANNHFWNNSFETVKSIHASVITKSKIGSLHLSTDLINNYIVLNENILPQQISEPIQFFNAEYSKTFSSKKFEVFLQMKYQKILKGEEYLRIPELTLSADLSYQLELKTLPTKIGVKAFYFTEYFANAYDPSLNDFYIQNEMKIGNYPFFDFYLQSKVKTVELKFMISHFNSGLTGYNYYITPLYPMATRNFSFSFIWFFRD